MTRNGSTPVTTEALVCAAQEGDEEAREQVVRRHWNSIGSTASRVVKRTVDIQDDMWSVALIALNEAIDAYEEQSEASFRTFAEMVMSRRVIDEVRKHARRKDVPLTLFDGGESDSYNPVVIKEAERRAFVYEQGNELAREVANYRDALQEYGVELDALVASSPRQRGACERAWKVADLVVEDPEARSRFTSSKRLPLKQLTQMPECPVSRQTMERHRAYIVAIVTMQLGDFGRIQSVARG